jgi:hypothetical protein
MIIVATPDGIEIDGILLKNTVEMQTYISAHRPQDLEVTLHPLPIPVDLYVNFGIWKWFKDLEVKIGVSQPYDLEVSLRTIMPYNLYTDIAGHQPSDLDVVLSPIPYHQLLVEFWSVHQSYLYAELGIHPPYDLEVPFNIMKKHDLYTQVKVHSPKDFTVFMRIFQHGITDLYVFANPVHSGFEDLYVNFWGWGIRTLSVPIGGHAPFDLIANIYGWRYSDLDAAISASAPQDLAVDFVAAPEDGYDLIVTHRTFRTSHLLVDFDIWLGLYTLPVYVWGVYFSDFSATFTMGGKHDFTINLPGTSSYRDLFVTLKPASRVMTTIIPVLTVEIHDLYVSINQGWPCGFGSSYSNFSVTFKPAFFLALEVLFKVIDGSGVSNLGTYLNRSNFTSYLNSYGLEFYLPQTTWDMEAKIVDQLPVVYNNQFDDIVTEVMQLRFSWPRIRIFSGNLNLTIDLVAYKQDPYHDLTIDLFAFRPDVPKMPTSQPIVQRTQSWEEPVWPAVFQVKEIELWAEDPPEVVRIIEVVFGEQVHDYYWVSNEQRAYKKEDYERWSAMARGYLPHAEYSGQIDYVSLYEISDMENYQTIDAAFKALISAFTYKGQSKLEVYIKATGGYRDLNVFMDIWGTDRFYNLAVFIEPAHLHDLSVEINCVS